MKKSAFVLLVMAAVACCEVKAQDTIHTTQPLENYYYFYWHNYQPGDSIVCDVPIGYEVPENYEGIIMLTQSPITIYGIAVGAVIKYADSCFDKLVWDSVNNRYQGQDPLGYYDADSVWHLIGDSALDETYMDFVIMQRGTQVTEVSEHLRLHMKYDTVAYYLDPEFNYFIPNYYTCKPLPVYEKYFKDSVIVSDVFYLGGYNHSAERCIHNSQKYHEIMFSGWGNFDNVRTNYVIHWANLDGHWEEYPGYVWQWLFPILTPNPNPDTTTYIPPDDTTHVPGDSTQTSIRTNTWERYVSLQPNPASDEATVLSSFGIDEVEVFDMAGSRVLLQQASGLAAKLDVKALPRGSYIVRIHTPMGTTSRKLVVQ